MFVYAELDGIVVMAEYNSWTGTQDVPFSYHDPHTNNLDRSSVVFQSLQANANLLSRPGHYCSHPNL